MVYNSCLYVLTNTSSSSTYPLLQTYERVRNNRMIRNRSKRRRSVRGGGTGVPGLSGAIRGSGGTQPTCGAVPAPGGE